MTTTAAMGELVNQLTSVLTNDHQGGAGGGAVAGIFLDWHGFQPAPPTEPAGLGHEVFHVFDDEPAVSMHFIDSGLDNGFKINQSPLAWRRRVHHAAIASGRNARSFFAPARLGLYGYACPSISLPRSTRSRIAASIFISSALADPLG